MNDVFKEIKYQLYIPFGNEIKKHLIYQNKNVMYLASIYNKEENKWY